MALCLLVWLFFPPEFAPLSFPINKQIIKNLKTECQYGKYHPDCVKTDSCKQLANNLCNAQSLISLAIVEETYQHVLIYFTPSNENNG